MVREADDRSIWQELEKVMNDGNPDFYGRPEEHERTCRFQMTLRGKDCDCSYLHPTVEHHKDYASMARGNNYPFDEDIDYDPRIDNADDAWSGHE